MSRNLNLDEISSAKGSYILQIHVMDRIVLDIKSLKNPEIAQGRYLYCGSANGPGGMGARVKRHAKRDKKAHWHVDRLTIPFGVEALSVFEGASECDLVAHLCKLDFCDQPYVKFGSSDCETCTAHLVRIKEGFNMEDCGLSAPVFHPRRGKVF
ncbi:hypothetical protein MTBPR1_150035 [Candidatus Terasakiella magnetica]|uniref:GIY-YIG domain-containing protein n=1 Tax=Candidatus Terasakiella magnetica TaxID=1867952 RepID=A0A1C3RFE8_9PROT|nr:GIY-YIG nuclease family protein [Candidatus Terasakiella magnetica]SCA55988.1 hypothetical protein MTBPR1_150035 [Candidatus Terasakiella magnetica]